MIWHQPCNPTYIPISQHNNDSHPPSAMKPVQIHLLIFYLVISLCFCGMKSALTEAEVLLKWKSTIYHPGSLASWSFVNSTTPCSWFGIGCNKDGKVTELTLPYSNLNGTVNNLDFTALPKLNFLNLSGNSFTGEIPSAVKSCTSLQVIDLGGNGFYGSIPIFPSIYVLILESNEFSGSINKSLCKMKGLVMLDLSRNHLFGNLPRCLSAMSNMTFLSLENNNFSEKIDGSIFGSFRSLQVLHLNNNSFSGELPSLLRNCSRLVTLNLGENKLSGNIPTWFGESFPLLKILRLRSNKFSGSIPPQLGLLTSLQYLDLGHNNLSGSIPTSFSHLKAMTVRQQNMGFLTGGFSDPSGRVIFDSALSMLVYWKGKEQIFGGTLSLISGIDLSNNQLSGEIPGELTVLAAILLLDLSRNELVGEIPELISSLHFLEFLDLSENALSGLIPPTISSLTFLDSLNLSNNYLYGRIPKGSQLQTFDMSSYSGNDGLCGPPLIKKCATDPQASAREMTKLEHEDEVTELYLSMGLGFTVGLLGFCVILIFNQTSKTAYYQFIDKIQNQICTREEE